jgi:hypothetical protein
MRESSKALFWPQALGMEVKTSGPGLFKQDFPYFGVKSNLALIQLDLTEGDLMPS